MELAPGYLPAVYNCIRKAGALCIADEVQSGFARTGSHFWGFEAHDVVPDIVTMAKVVPAYHHLHSLPPQCFGSKWKLPKYSMFLVILPDNFYDVESIYAAYTNEYQIKVVLL